LNFLLFIATLMIVDQKHESQSLPEK